MEWARDRIPKIRSQEFAAEHLGGRVSHYRLSRGGITIHKRYNQVYLSVHITLTEQEHGLKGKQNQRHNN
jgi:hypothetical protein